MTSPAKPARRRLPKRAWQLMLSGRRLDILDPSPLDIEIGDIAHGLARVARWNGQTRGTHAFCVAEHCVLVERIAAWLKPDLAARWRLAALLHDAPEYVIGDMISPFKAALGPEYKAIEGALEAAIHVRFGLPARLSATISRLIKRADRISAALEAAQLAGFTRAECARHFVTPPPKLRITLHPLPVMEAQAAYLSRFEALCADMGAKHA